MARLTDALSLQQTCARGSARASSACAVLRCTSSCRTLACASPSALAWSRSASCLDCSLDSPSTRVAASALLRPALRPHRSCKKRQTVRLHEVHQAAPADAALQLHSQESAHLTDQTFAHICGTAQAI